MVNNTYCLMIHDLQRAATSPQFRLADVRSQHTGETLP